MSPEAATGAAEAAETEESPRSVRAALAELREARFGLTIDADDPGATAYGLSLAVAAIRRIPQDQLPVETLCFIAPIAVSMLKPGPRTAPHTAEGFAYLQHILVTESARDAAYAAGLVAAAVAALERRSSASPADEAVHTAGFRLLTNLVRIESTDGELHPRGLSLREALVTGGVLKAGEKALSVFGCRSAEVASQVCECLRRVLQPKDDDNPSRHASISDGLAAEVVASLKAHADVQAVVKEASLLIIVLFRNCNLTETRRLFAPCAPVLAAAVIKASRGFARSPLSTIEVVALAVNVLDLLAAVPDTHPAAHTVGGFAEALVRTLDEVPRAADVSVKLISATIRYLTMIASLASSAPALIGAQQAIVAAGAIEAAIGAMRDFPQSALIQTNGAAMVQQYLRAFSGARRAVSAGGGVVLQAAESAVPDDDAHRSIVRDCLQTITRVANALLETPLGAMAQLVGQPVSGPQQPQMQHRAGTRGRGARRGARDSVRPGGGAGDDEAARARADSAMADLLAEEEREAEARRAAAASTSAGRRGKGRQQPQQTPNAQSRPEPRAEPQDEPRAELAPAAAELSPLLEREELGGPPAVSPVAEARAPPFDGRPRDSTERGDAATAAPAPTAVPTAAAHLVPPVSPFPAYLLPPSAVVPQPAEAVRPAWAAAGGSSSAVSMPPVAPGETSCHDGIALASPVCK